MNAEKMRSNEKPKLGQCDPILTVNLSVCRVNGEDVRLMLWDTAGQEEFDAITKAYYRGK